MISFNENDFNIIQIKKQSKLINLATKYSYRVYGLAHDDENPLIHIRYNIHKIKEPRYLNSVEGFLNENNLPHEVTHDLDYDSTKIAIGLRRDLREHVVLSAAILQTIVYGIEGRINFRRYKIKNIPKFN